MKATWMIGGLLAILAVGLASCTGGIPGVSSGQCHHSTTGEVLKEVVDINGNLFPVKKAENPLAKKAGLDVDYCGISVQAQMGGSSFLGHVYHPDTRSEITVGDAYKGLRLLLNYEWY